MAEADSAQPELAQEAADPAAVRAAVVLPRFELGRRLGFQSKRESCHSLLSSDITLTLGTAHPIPSTEFCLPRSSAPT